MPIPLEIGRKKGKHIQIFSDGCEQCSSHIVNVEVGKCAGCIVEVYDMKRSTEIIKEKMLKYNVSYHPTTIIDEEIKVEGKPDFYWMCGDDFYDKLRKSHPL